MGNIEITLDEKTSELLYEGYLIKEDEYDSFEDYIDEVSEYLNLKMRQQNIKSELEYIDIILRDKQYLQRLANGESYEDILYEIQVSMQK